jgi:hypothetical protein
MFLFNSRQSQTPCEERAESGGSLKEKMAGLPKERRMARLFIYW